MTKSKIVLLFGAILIALRLFFPVLQCKYEESSRCSKGYVAFLSTGPSIHYIFHEKRTYTQAAGIAVVTLALVFVLRKEKRSSRS